jgi:hypothetical protein
MPRFVLLVLTALFVAAACTSVAQPSSSPTKTPDIKRSKLDVAYSGLTDDDVFAPTSKEVLTAALQAMRDEIQKAGGRSDIAATPEFSDKSEPSNEDFKKFADAASKLAVGNPLVSGDRLADVALTAMAKVKPDCHTQYVKRSSAVPSGVSAARVDSGGHVRADESQLTSQLLPGGVGYISWRQWIESGTYKQHVEVQKVMDALLAQGAKAWLFDVSNNGGGIQNQLMMSWFNNGEPLVKIRLKNGFAGSIEAKKELRLPAQYQLPIAVVVNGRSASMSEMFALAFKETKRGTLFGSKTIGCLGATNILNLIDGSVFQYTVSEFVGAISNAAYNNVGIPPDQTVAEGQAIDAAANFLREQIAKGSKP